MDYTLQALALDDLHADLICSPPPLLAFIETQRGHLVEGRPHLGRLHRSQCLLGLYDAAHQVWSGQDRLIYRLRGRSEAPPPLSGHFTGMRLMKLAEG